MGLALVGEDRALYSTVPCGLAIINRLDFGFRRRS